MLARRLHLAQIDLLSHRLWLKAFTTAHRAPTERPSIRPYSCTSKTFASTSPARQAHTKARQQWSTQTTSVSRQKTNQTTKHGEAAHRAPSKRSFDRTHTRTSKTSASASGTRQAYTKARKQQNTSSTSVWRQNRDETPKISKAKHSKVKQIHFELYDARDRLSKAVQAVDVKTVILLYEQLPEPKPLTPSDLDAITQCVLQNMRAARYAKNTGDVKTVLSFAERLVRDIQREALQPSLLSHLHLLVIFKELHSLESGMEFWKWLEKQEDDYVDLEVYAVAIEILALKGYPLQELEELYSIALARFPGNFSAYHLSPGAILPDRDKPLHLKGIPMSLLKSIAYARALRGDSQNMYLAFDTAFRLFPASVAPNFMHMIQHERPTTEWFTVFATASRAGMSMSSQRLRTRLIDINLCSDATSVMTHCVTLRVILAALYLQLGSGGGITSSLVQEFLIPLTQVFRLPDVGAMDLRERAELVEIVLQIIRQTWTVFARYGSQPTVETFNSMIANVAGHGQAKRVIRIVEADMKALGLDPDKITHRSFVTAASLLGDNVLLEESWEKLVASCREQSSSPNAHDLRIMMKAARSMDRDGFARREFLKHQARLTASELDEIEEGFMQPKAQGNIPDSPTHSAREILDYVRSIQCDLDFIDKHTEQAPGVQNFRDQDLPVTLLPLPKHLAIPEADMRGIYDSLTSEQPTSKSSDKSSVRHDENSSEVEKMPSVSPSPDKGRRSETVVTIPTSTFSSTNVSFSQLRYEHWKAVNYLLWLAERNDQEFKDEVNRAVASQLAPPERRIRFTTSEMEAMKAFGLADLDMSRKGPKRATADEVAAAKSEILRLRGTTRRS